MGRRWVIPDIHGCINTLTQLVENNIRLTKEDSIFFLGDYIDRGPDGKGVIDYLIDLKEKGYDVISAQSSNKRKYVSSLPKNLKWNDVHLNSYTKNRFESSNNQKTHSKALTSQNSKVTLVPYNIKYKNKILPYK